MKTKSAREHEIEVDTFARWFGVILVNLRTHDLRLSRQAREHKSYAREAEIDMVTLVTSR